MKTKTQRLGVAILLILLLPLTIMAGETPNLKTAVVGGGCFWCTEAIFQRVEGVHNVEPGYAGGDTPTPYL